MKLVFKIAFVFFVVIAGCDQRPSEPSIVFERTKWDFGDVDEDSEISYEFVFQNVGKLPLKIEKVQASCGCLVVEYPKIEIQSGAKGKIILKPNLAKSINPQQTDATIFTNDPEKREITLYVKGRIKPCMMVSTERIHFGNIRPNDKKHKNINVMIPIKSKNKASVPTELKFETSLPAITTKIIDQRITETQYGWIKVIVCEISIASNENYGTFKEVLTIYNQGSKETILLTGEIKGHIDVVPERLFVNIKGSDHVWEKVLDIIYMGDESFNISEIQASNRGIETELLKFKSNHYKLKVKIYPDRISTNFLDEEVTIVSNDALQPNLKIPIKGWFRE